MKKAATTLILLAAMLLVGMVVEAQQTKTPRIGFLSRNLHPADSRAGSTSAQNLAALRQGLRELGYVEDKNIIVEYRFADERLERLPALTQDLIRLKVDVIVTDTTLTARAARKVTSTTPIVMANGSDPVRSGLVASLAQPAERKLERANQVIQLTASTIEPGTGHFSPKGSLPVMDF